MAKSKGDKFYSARIAGTGIHRIDGIVREVNEAGVVIDVKEAGRQRRVPTMIEIKDIVCHTGEGAGFVVAKNHHDLEPIAGEVVSEDASGITIKDTDGTEITFPANGAGGAQFVQVGEDDRMLKRSNVANRVSKLAEREDGSAGKKSSKKSGKKSKGDDDAKSAKSSGKARRRRSK